MPSVLISSHDVAIMTLVTGLRKDTVSNTSIAKDLQCPRVKIAAMRR